MIKNKLLVLFIALLFASSAFACNLGMGHTAFSKDTLQFGDTLLIRTVIINYDNVPYNGTIELAYKLNGVENINEKIFSDSLSGQTFTIPAGDSIVVFLHVIITPSYFITGPDILVVWPICPAGSSPHTRINATIIVAEPTGIYDIASSELKITVFTAAGSIYIRNNDPEFTLNQVRIFDIMGREINSTACPGNQQQIQLTDRPPGIYLAEVRLNNGQKAVFKVFKY